MSRNYILWLSVLIFGTLSASALAVPIFSNTSTNTPFNQCTIVNPQVAHCYDITGLGSYTEPVRVYADIGVASDIPDIPVSASNSLEVDMFTDKPIAPAVLNLSWGLDSDFAGCCFFGSSYGGSVWDLETGTPVLVYSWTNSTSGHVTLPFKLGIPFSVNLFASLGAVWTNPEMNLAPSGFHGPIANVSVDPITVPEPGSFVFMLVGLGTAGVRTALRYRWNRS
jgi:hypothetical protein